MSHRDYWFVRLSDNNTLIVSRDSETKRTLASMAALSSLVPPQEVEFDPDNLVVGTVLESDNGRVRTVTGITKMPGMAVTIPPIEPFQREFDGEPDP